MKNRKNSFSGLSTGTKVVTLIVALAMVAAVLGAELLFWNGVIAPLCGFPRLTYVSLFAISLMFTAATGLFKALTGTSRTS